VRYAEPTDAEISALKQSVALENQADSYAMNLRFREAVSYMKEANAIRSRVFGRGLDPNDLRARTMSVLAPPHSQIERTEDE
jgi:hypothetical protein